MPPAARITDMHTCPLVTGLVPHVGGPIIPPAMPNVLIGFLPAARITDKLICVGPPDMIAMGSPTVLIGKLMAARLGDPTVHGGIIVMGEPTVMIGEVGMGSGFGPGKGLASVVGAMGRSGAGAPPGKGMGGTGAGGVSPQGANLAEAAAEGIATAEKCPYADH